MDKISIVIPTYNEEKNIARCLDSIFSQNYDNLDVIIVDDNSTDRTVEIAKKYPVRIFKNGEMDAQRGKMIGFKKAKGKFFMYMDADETLPGKNWFGKMLKPMKENKKIAGTFTTYFQHKDYSIITRYLTYQELQLDPVFEFFSPRIKDTVIEEKDDYKICEYRVKNIPADGRYLFRMSVLKKSEIANKRKFMDVDNMVILVKEGHTKYAFVPDAGHYHFTATGIKEMMLKKIRNINRNYIVDPQKRHYNWFDLTNKKDVVKITAWILYANTLIFPTIKGIYKSVKHRDLICMLEPVMAFLLTNTIIYGFVVNKLGRDFLKNTLRQWIS